MKELWLEYGFIKDNEYHDLCWYNEGRWQELPHFIMKRIKWMFRKDVYFIIRFQ